MFVVPIFGQDRSLDLIKCSPCECGAGCGLRVTAPEKDHGIPEKAGTTSIPRGFTTAPQNTGELMARREEAFEMDMEAPR